MRQIFHYLIAVIIFLNTCKQNIEKEYYSTGQLKSVSQINSKGEKHGISKTYYNSG